MTGTAQLEIATGGHAQRVFTGLAGVLAPKAGQTTVGQTGTGQAENSSAAPEAFPTAATASEQSFRAGLQQLLESVDSSLSESSGLSSLETSPESNAGSSVAMSVGTPAKTVAQQRVVNQNQGNQSTPLNPQFSPPPSASLQAGRAAVLQATLDAGNSTPSPSTKKVSEKSGNLEESPRSNKQKSASGSTSSATGPVSHPANLSEFLASGSAPLAIPQTNPAPAVLPAAGLGSNRASSQTSLMAFAGEQDFPASEGWTVPTGAAAVANHRWQGAAASSQIARDEMAASVRLPADRVSSPAPVTSGEKSSAPAIHSAANSYGIEPAATLTTQTVSLPRAGASASSAQAVSQSTGRQQATQTAVSNTSGAKALPTVRGVAAPPLTAQSAFQFSLVSSASSEHLQQPAAPVESRAVSDQPIASESAAQSKSGLQTIVAPQTTETKIDEKTVQGRPVLPAQSPRQSSGAGPIPTQPNFGPENKNSLTPAAAQTQPTTAPRTAISEESPTVQTTFLPVPISAAKRSDVSTPPDPMISALIGARAAQPAEQQTPSVAETKSGIAHESAPAGTSLTPQSEAAPVQTVQSSAPEPATKHSSAAAAHSTPSASATSVQPAVHNAAAMNLAGTEEGLRAATSAIHGNLIASSSASATAPRSEARETFAALDAATSPAPAATWVHAGPGRAEAGFEDANLGWVSVRANQSSDGIHAMLVPGSAEAASALGSHLHGLSNYLTENHSPVSSLSVGTPEGRSTALDSGTQQGAGNSRGEATDQRPARWSDSGVETVQAESAAETMVPFVSGSGGTHISVIA